MIDTQMLVGAFARNFGVIKAQVAGLTHDDSVTQTPYNINCLNWVVGHIVDGRDGMLKEIGAPGVLDAASGLRYRRESEPIIEDGPGVLSIETLMEALGASQEQLGELLPRMTDDQLVAEVEGWNMKVGEYVFFQYFHDTYHTGQTDLLRQVSGTADKII